MLKSIPLKDILFLDIETVPQHEKYSDLDEKMQEFWKKKAARINPKGKAHELYERAGIFSEFGKIICISTGLITQDKSGQMQMRLKSFFSDDEKKLLKEFRELLSASYKEKFLCAHNGKEFDFPYIARRMLVNGIALPEPLDIAGRKPWEVRHLDTLELWKFGDYKHYTSLNLLTYIFNIPTPKDDIDGSMVKNVYYQEKNLKRIARYCEKDTAAVAQLFLRYSNKQIIQPENIISVGLK